MPEIPQLQTGMDVSNTLFKLAAMKQMQNQQDIENQRAASQDTRQNALFTLQEKEAQLKLRDAQNKAIFDDSAYISNLPKEQALEFYNKSLKPFYGQTGITLPDFKTPDEVMNWASTTSDSYTKLYQKGKEIKGMVIANANFKPSLPESSSNPRNLVIDGYGDGKGGVVPTTQKPYLEGMKQDETVRHNKESESTGRMNAQANRQRAATGAEKSKRDKLRPKRVGVYDTVDKTIKYYNPDSPHDAAIMANPRYRLLPIGKAPSIEDVEDLGDTTAIQSQTTTIKRNPGETIEQFLLRTKGK